jgi:hypothetical protein
MHNFDVFLDLVRQEELVSLSLRGAENDCLAKATITNQNIG